MYTYTPLAVPAAHPRDPNFVTPDEAALVAQALIVASPDLAISGVEAIPPVPNLYPDGRVYILLNFVKSIQVTNSMGRQQIVPVPFSEVAGLLLDFAKDSPAHTFEFLAESTGSDTWLGDVE